jgi:hypothetical protein
MSKRLAGVLSRVMISMAPVLLLAGPASAMSAHETSTSTRLPWDVASVSVKNVVRTYDGHGHLIAKHVFHRADVNAARILRKDLVDSGTSSVGPKAQGTGREDITYTNRGFAGEKLFTFDVWIKWSWYHVSCPCTMSLIDKGNTPVAYDDHWSFNKVAFSENHYNAGGGGPHTSYTHLVQGEFVGTSIAKNGKRVTTIYRRPVISETANNDGTDDWYKVCC